MLKTQTDNPNYLAKVVNLPEISKHPHADRLQVVRIDFQNVITGLDAKEGDLYVYFPLECQINKAFMKFSNGFSDKGKNADNTKGGFFNKHARVKATRLRSVLSEGYIHPVANVNEWLKDAGIKYQITDKDAGSEFDSFGDTLFVNKYVVPTKGNGGTPKNKQAARATKLVDDQFRVHADTAQLKRNMFKIEPEDIVSISYKIHGCNATFANVLCKKPLKLYEKVLKKVGVNIVDTQYDDVFSSRRVIKNAYADKVQDSFYTFDVWTEAAKRLEGKIKPGISLYCELAGQMPGGSWIQPDYDYGMLPNEFGIWAFRITYTSIDGSVMEFTKPQIAAYCEKYDIPLSPQFYYGKAKDIYPDIKIDEQWHENVLERLKTQYNEKNCYMCSNKVPEEGVVVRKEGEAFEAYKLKSEKFLSRETAELDKGTVNIEDET